MRALWLLCIALLLSACGETVTWGYRNQLSHTVTVVEHGWSGTQRVTLASHQTIPPHWGQLPSSIDLVAPDGRGLGHYRVAEIPRVGPQHILDYLVITPSRVYVESEQPKEDSESASQ